MELRVPLLLTPTLLLSDVAHPPASSGSRNKEDDRLYQLWLHFAGTCTIYLKSSPRWVASQLTNPRWLPLSTKERPSSSAQQETPPTCVWMAPAISFPGT